MTKHLSPADIKRLVEILDPHDSEYGVSYQIHPENKLSKCGVFVPSLIETVELLARSLASAVDDLREQGVMFMTGDLQYQWMNWAWDNRREQEQGNV